MVVREIMGGQFLSLREAYISSLSLLRSLEPLEKFLGGWVVVVLKPILVISPRPRTRLINKMTMKSPCIENYRAAAAE